MSYVADQRYVTSHRLLYRRCVTVVFTVCIVRCKTMVSGGWLSHSHVLVVRWLVGGCLTWTVYGPNAVTDGCVLG